MIYAVISLPIGVVSVVEYYLLSLEQGDGFKENHKNDVHILILISEDEKDMNPWGSIAGVISVTIIVLD